MFPSQNIFFDSSASYLRRDMRLMFMIIKLPHGIYLAGGAACIRALAEEGHAFAATGILAIYCARAPVAVIQIRPASFESR